MKTKQSVSDDIRRQIELRAYFIWEREGYPDGREAEHWARAEAEILGDPPPNKATKAESPAPAKAASAKPAAAKKPGTNGSAKKAKANARPDAPVKAAAKTAAAKKPGKTRAAKSPE